MKKKWLRIPDLSEEVFPYACNPNEVRLKIASIVWNHVLTNTQTYITDEIKERHIRAHDLFVSLLMYFL